MNEEQKYYIDQVNSIINDDILIKEMGLDGISLPPHQHSRTQVVMTLQGTLHVQIGGREYFVPERHICWIPSGMKHTLSSNNQKVAVRIYYVNMRYVDNAPANVFAVYKDSPWASINLQYMADFGAQISSQRHSLYTYCMSFFRLFPDAAKQFKLPWKGVPLEGEYVFLDALDYIHTHLAENVKFDEVAEAVGASSRSLSRMFYSEGMRFSDFINYERITRALELMGDHTLPISKIAKATGFCSASNFNRSFKLVMGMSPTEMKAEAKTCRQK